MCVPDDLGGRCLRKSGGRAARDGLSSKDLSLERFESTSVFFYSFNHLN